MSLLSWSYRGLGNPQTVNTLKNFIRLEDPNLVFLMETKSNEEWVKIVRNQCSFKDIFVIPSDGLKGGGVALFWKFDIKVDVLNALLSFIDALIEGGDRIGCWHLSSFYGHPKTSQRVESWRLLNSLKDSSQLPWLMIGDFSEIRCQAEKEGGASKPVQQMAWFNASINYCGLKEVGFVGPKFMWLYQRQVGTQIKERLDKA